MVSWVLREKGTEDMKRGIYFSLTQYAGLAVALFAFRGFEYAVHISVKREYWCWGRHKIPDPPYYDAREIGEFGLGPVVLITWFED